MNRLYCVRIHLGKLKIEEVTIVKETPKAYTVGANGEYRTVVRKSEIERVDTNVLGSFVFTFNIEEAKQILKEHYDKKIKGYLKNIKTCENINRQLEMEG